MASAAAPAPPAAPSGLRSSGPPPPTDLLRVVDDAFEVSEVEALYRALMPIPRMPAALLYMPKADFDRLARGDRETIEQLEGYIPSALVAFLPRYVAQVERAAPPAEPICGIEIFLSLHASPEVARHAGLHLDSNEPDWDAARVSWGSIFHVGPGEIIEGGGTAFYPRLPVPENVLARCFMPNTFESLSALTTEWYVAPRRQNRLLVFDGRLPHYAGPCRARPEEPRIALVVTGWSTPPRFTPKEGFSHLTAEEYRAFIEEPEANLGAVRAHYDLGRAIGDERLATLDSAMRKVLGM